MYGFVAYFVERPTWETQAEQCLDTVLANRKLARDSAPNLKSQIAGDFTSRSSDLKKYPQITAERFESYFQIARLVI